MARREKEHLNLGDQNRKEESPGYGGQDDEIDLGCVEFVLP